MNGDYFDGSRDTAEKIIVMMMTSESNDDIRVADKMKSILEAM